MVLQFKRSSRDILPKANDLLDLLIEFLCEGLGGRAPLTHSALLRIALERSADGEGEFGESDVLVEDMEIVRQQGDSLGDDSVLGSSRCQVELGQLDCIVDLGRLGGGRGLLHELFILFVRFQRNSKRFKAYLNDVEEEGSDGNVHTGDGGDLDVEIHTVKTEGVISGSGNEIDSAVNDLDEGIHQGLESSLERRLCNHIRPKTQTVDKLPIIHGVDSTRHFHTKLEYSVSVMEVIALRI